MLDQSVGEAARGVSLARARGHLDERARMCGAKRFFEMRDAFDLAGAEVLGRQRIGCGHGRKAGAKGCRFDQPRGKRLRTMEREDATRTRGRIASVAEVGFDAGGLVKER